MYYFFQKHLYKYIHVKENNSRFINGFKKKIHSICMPPLHNSGLDEVINNPGLYMSYYATKRGCPSDESVVTEVPCNTKLGTIYIPSCAKAKHFERSGKCWSPSPVMVTFSIFVTYCEQDIKDSDQLMIFTVVDNNNDSH